MEAERAFGPELDSPRRARRFAHRLLVDDVPEDVLQQVLLMISEVVTNAVIHARTPISVDLRLGTGSLLVGVTDSAFDTASSVLLQANPPGHPTGRGLRIVDSLADAWGVERTEGAKRVWFEVTFVADPSERPSAASAR